MIQLLVLLLLVPKALTVAPFGLQSNDEDVASTYAASMRYDPSLDRVYITGSSYGRFFDPGYPFDTKVTDRDCFFASAQLPRVAGHGAVWLRRESFGDENTLETCSDIILRSNPAVPLKEYSIIGHSNAYPSLLDEFTNHSEESSVYGMVLDLDMRASLEGGYVFHSNETQYPVAMALDKDGEDFFVALVQSDTEYKGSSYERFINDQFDLQPDPALTKAFLPKHYGSNYAVKLVRMGPKEDDTLEDTGEGSGTTETKWVKNMVTDEGKTVYVSSIAQHAKGGILIAGFTDGSGNDYGEVDSDMTEDGFITGIDPSNGETVHAMRLRSITNSTDRILGICMVNNPESSEFFVVGMTDDTGEESIDGSFKAFILKLDARSFTLHWASEVRALSDGLDPTEVYGVDCAVTPDDELVYITGTVKDGASLTINGSIPISSSAGKDDIFVGQLRVDSGEIMYIKQIGTNEDDSMATGNSVLCDNDGNAILLANTKGSFFRERSYLGEGITSDVVVFSVSRDSGEHMELLWSPAAPEEAQEKFDNETHVANQTIVDVGSNWTSVDGNETKTNLTATPPLLQNATEPISLDRDDEIEEEEDPLTKAFIVTIALLAIVIVASVMTIIGMRHQVKKNHRSKGRSIRHAERDVREVGKTKGGNVVYREGDYENESVYLEDERSYVSRITIRGAPNGQKEQTDTLLRLEPSYEEAFRGNRSSVKEWDVLGRSYDRMRSMSSYSSAPRSPNGR